MSACAATTEAAVPSSGTAAGIARWPVAFVIVVVALLLAVRAFAAEPFLIPSQSMAPTLQPGDQVLVDKLAYRFGEPRRDDLVAFDDNESATSSSSASSACRAIAWSCATAC